MCGIIGIIGKAPVTPLLLDALRRLEYRGYDSAGVATLVNGHIDRRRAEGKLVNLEDLLVEKPLPGTIGIGHTRWATHGKPSERNAHPIATDRVAVVHNGIIENYEELKQELTAQGCRFDSDTDTEVVAHLLTCYLDEQKSPEEAMQLAMQRLRGAFALTVLIAGRHDILMAARRGSSLAVGHGKGAMYVGTDALALSPFTSTVTYLEDHEWVVLTKDGVTIYRGSDVVTRKPKASGISGALIGKGNHSHFMLKEMHEQPAVVGDTLRHYLGLGRSVSLPALPFDWREVPRITITACGTAFFAGLLAKYWFEKLARLPVEAEVASEMRYREPPLPTGGVTLAVSQSGETIDTLAALDYAKRQGQKLLSVVNVPESAIARLCDAALPTHAGPEIGVASTKAFVTQLSVLLCAAIDAGRARGHLSDEEAKRLAGLLVEVPAKLDAVLQMEDVFKRLGAERFWAEAKSALYLGRGTSSVVAFEGALKLKELAYIHAEGYAGGEMKHGPIALIDETMPVVIIAPPDPVLFDKISSNFEQVIARNGPVILLSDKVGVAKLDGKATRSVVMPDCDPLVAPIIYTVAVQLMAYYTALARGTDIDQPRNLAKSVTVE